MMSVLVLVVLLSGNIYGRIQKDENADLLTETETVAEIMKQERTLVSSTGIDEMVEEEVENSEIDTEADQTQATADINSEGNNKENDANVQTDIKENNQEQVSTEQELAESENETGDTEMAAASINAITPYTQLGMIRTPVCTEYQDYVEQICSAYDIMPELVVAIMETESGGVRTAYNGSYGCVGLMQINESVHQGRMKKLGVTDLYDPYSNILVGVDLLSELLENDDQNVYLALAHYHGERDANYRTNAGNYSSYVKKIIARTQELLSEQGKDSMY